MKRFTAAYDPDFRKLFDALPPAVQKAALESLRLWKENHLHNSLHFKKLKHADRNDLFSMRVNINYRMLGQLKDGNVLNWYWIGPHSEYDKILRRK